MQTVISGLLIGGVYAVIAVGLTLIFGVMRVINMAHGDFLMVGMYVAYWAYTLANLDPFWAPVLSGPVVFGIGLLLYRFVAGRVAHTREENTLLLTAGISLALSNLAMFLWRPDYRYVRTAYTTATFGWEGVAINWALTIAFCISAGLFLGVHLFLQRTWTGFGIRAAAQDREAAIAMGVDVDSIAALTFGLGAGLAAIAGSLLTPAFYIYPTVGSLFLIKSFVVVVLGGLGSVPGAAVGGLILGLGESLGAVYIGSGYRDVVGLVIFLLVLLLRPAGLFGTARQ